jgi:hypothetical protein
MGDEAMKRWGLLLCLLALGPFLIETEMAWATGLPAQRTPLITITSPASGATIYGTSLTVTVAVKNFQLVPPVYINPPKLSGNRGHIHYVLDDLANFNARRDAKIALSHTWTNVSPGRHTIIAYLATSQHAQFPGTKQARVTVMLVPRSSSRAGQSTSTVAQHVTSAPRSGGADGNRRADADILLLIAGSLALIVGLALLAGRVLLRD